MEHPKYEFETKGGLHVKLEWSAKSHEYRAYRATKYEWVDMKLGAVLPEPLKQYVTEKY